jgi:hypothetical protein
VVPEMLPVTAPERSRRSGDQIPVGVLTATDGMVVDAPSPRPASGLL